MNTFNGFISGKNFKTEHRNTNEWRDTEKKTEKETNNWALGEEP